jgi:hypothetical protein
MVPGNAGVHLCLKAEWSNARALRACDPSGSRGFESYPRRLIIRPNTVLNNSGSLKLVAFELKGVSIDRLIPAFKTRETQDNYLIKLRMFFEFCRLEPDDFVALVRKNPRKAEDLVTSYILQRKGKVSGSTIHNFRMALKLLLSMNDSDKLNWVRIGKIMPMIVVMIEGEACSNPCGGIVAPQHLGFRTDRHAAHALPACSRVAPSSLAYLSGNRLAWRGPSFHEILMFPVVYDENLEANTLRAARPNQLLQQ